MKPMNDLIYIIPILLVMIMLARIVYIFFTIW